MAQAKARRLTRAAPVECFHARGFAVERASAELDGQRLVIVPQEDPAAPSLALTAGDDYQPSGEGVRLYLTVDDVESVLARAVDAGGEIAAEVDVVEGWGRYASFRDLEGSVIGITEPEPEAAPETDAG